MASTPRIRQNFRVGTTRFDFRTALAGVAVLLQSSCGSVDGSPGMVTDVRVVINEVVAKSTTADANGKKFDWVELYNPMNRPLDLQGFYLSDSIDEWYKYEIPRNTVISPRSYLVFVADTSGASTDPLTMPFGLGKDGDDVVFTAPEGVILDSVEYAAAMEGQALARFPNGTGKFIWCPAVTPGANNGTFCRATKG